MSEEKQPLVDMDTINRLKELSEDTPEFLGELVDIYLEQADTLMAQLREAHDKGDAETYKRTAHTLKGSSLNIGALEFAEICKILEHKSLSEDKEDMSGLLEELEIVYPKTIQALKEFL